MMGPGAGRGPHKSLSHALGVVPLPTHHGYSQSDARYAHFPGDGPFSAHSDFIWIQIEIPEELQQEALDRHFIHLVLCTA